jgi:hypothetical protein
MPGAFQSFLLLMPEIHGTPFNCLNTNALAEQWFRKPPNFHVHKKEAAPKCRARPKSSMFMSLQHPNL